MNPFPINFAVRIVGSAQPLKVTGTFYDETTRTLTLGVHAETTARRWIRTSEQLPVHGEKVWGCFKGHRVTIYKYHKAMNHFSSETGTAYSISEVTHWMPREDAPLPPSSAPSPPPASTVGEGWRELGKREILRKGDEIGNMTYGFDPVDEDSLGREVWEGIRIAPEREYYRRRVTPAEFTTETAAPLGTLEPGMPLGAGGMSHAADAEPHTIIGQGDTAKHLQT